MKRVWVFADFSVPRSGAALKKWVDKIVDINPTDVVLGVNEDAPTLFEIRKPYKIDHYRQAGFALIDAGITPHLMSWVHDHNYGLYIPKMFDVLAPVLREWSAPKYRCPGTPTLLLDAEAHWLHKANNELPAAKLVCHHKQQHDLQVGLTGYAGIHNMHPRYKLLRAVSDYVLPQAYSNYTAKQPWTTSHWWKPGVCQRNAYDNWTGTGKPIVMGLGAWHQKRPGMTAAGAVQRAWDTCEALGVESVAYWSLKHILRRPEGRKIRELIEGMRNGS